MRVPEVFSMILIGCVLFQLEVNVCRHRLGLIGPGS